MLAAALVLSSFAATGKPENRKIGFSLGNDCWTGAIAYNNDDLLSYSFGLVWEGESLRVNLDAMGYTGRLLDDRFDLLQALFSYDFKPVRGLLLTPRVGFDLYGCLHLDAFQNSLHNLMKIKPLSLPYRKTDIDFIPVLGLQAVYTLPPDWSFVYANVCAESGLRYTEEAGIGVNYGFLSAFAGYRFSQGSMDNAVLDKSLSEAGGLRAGYTIDTGKFRMAFSFNPMTGNGNTVLTLSPLAKSRHGDFDYTLYHIKSSLFDFTLYSNEITFGNWVVVSRFSTGDLDGLRLDDWVWGVGYGFRFKGFCARAVAQYIHRWERLPSGTDYLHSFSNHAGIALELSYGVTLFENFRINALAGGAYIPDRGFGWELALGITFL